MIPLVSSYLHSQFVTKKDSRYLSHLNQLHLFKSFKFGGSRNVDDFLKMRTNLIEMLKDCQPNGIYATTKQRTEISSAVAKIENFNPTKNPASSNKMNGFWKMLYTDFSPVAASSGKLGPFVGDVYQDLNAERKEIINILNIKFPPIKGALVAKLSIPDKRTW